YPTVDQQQNRRPQEQGQHQPGGQRDQDRRKRRPQVNAPVRVANSQRLTPGSCCQQQRTIQGLEFQAARPVIGEKVETATAFGSVKGQETTDDQRRQQGAPQAQGGQYARLPKR